MLIILASSLISSTTIAWSSPYTSIDVGIAYGMITGGAYPNLVILDVRTKGEYDSGHIYGATLIPVTDLPTRIGELASHVNDEILVYCGSGGRSKTASGILDSNGFTRVYNMLGGITAWISGGYPTVIAKVHDVTTSFNYDTVQAAVDSTQTMDGDTILVDTGVYFEHVTIVKRLSIVGDDSGSTVIDGNGTGTAICIKADNVTVENLNVRNGAAFGLHLDGGNHAQIHNNKITNSYCGLNVSSSYNTILGNEIASNEYCSVSVIQGNNRIFENNITSNDYGLRLDSLQATHGNLIYHNNFLNNTYQASTSGASDPWDDGYPSGGNYWSNYNGTDLHGGVYQTLPGSDGVGDTPHAIDADNTDRYPLVRPWLWGPRSLEIVSAENGTTSPAPGNYAYNTTTYVQVTAIAYNNYTFDHWELDGCNFTGADQIDIRTDADHTLRAAFTRAKCALTIMSTAGGHTDPTAGTYLLEPDTETTVSASPDPGYYLDRWELDSLYIGIFSPVSVTMDENHTLQATFKQLDIGHNIATKWIASKTVVGQGFNLSIIVTIMNIGSHAEEFNVTACLQSTLIMIENVQLDTGAFTTLAFTMNTSLFSKGNSTIWAYSWPVSGETAIEDNNFTDGFVIVSMVGDLTGVGPWPGYPDGKVDGKDVTLIAKCFGSWPEAPPPMTWIPNADINNDGKVDGKDTTAVAKHFGTYDP